LNLNKNADISIFLKKEGKDISLQISVKFALNIEKQTYQYLKRSYNFIMADYEQSLCFLMVCRERSEKTGRPKVSRAKAVVWAKGEKKGTTDKASAFDLCVAPTTQKCDWLMLDSDESDDRPKLTGCQDKGNNWIAVN